MDAAEGDSRSAQAKEFVPLKRRKATDTPTILRWCSLNVQLDFFDVLWTM